MKRKHIVSSSFIQILLIALPAIAQDLPVNGNLTVSGAGKFVAGIDVGTTSQYTLDWDSLNARVASDINAIAGGFIWRDTYVLNNDVETAKNKMLLGSSNLLTLYKSDGMTVGLTLDPNAGKITLPAGVTGAGVYSGATPVLKTSATGEAIFSSKVLFENGADFGTGNTLKASNVQFLRGTLANLGYSETPSNATPISSIKTSGSITISRIVSSGTFQYAVGSFDGQATIGNQSVYEGASGSSGFVAKCDANGAAVWVKTIIPSNGYCWMSNVAINSSGAIAVVGSFSGTTQTFGMGKELVSTGTDGFVAVYNSSGTIEWTKSIGGSGTDYASAVAIVTDGTVTVGGLFETATTTLAPVVLTSAGSYDGVVVKFSPSGGVSWAKAIGGIDYDSLSTVSVDNAGNVLVSGMFSGALTTLGSANRTGAGYRDGFLVKLNGSDGQALWSKAIGGGSDDCLAGHVLDSSGNIIAFGTFSGATTNLETGKNLTSAGYSNGFVIKTDTSGLTQWTKGISSSGHSPISGGVVTADGKIVVTGTFSGSTTSLGSGLNVSAAGDSQDILFVQIDPSSGTVIKAQAIGSATGYEAVSSLSLSGTSGLCLIGYTGEVFGMGNSRMVPDSFNASWQGFDVITPALLPASAFSWSGGMASGTGSIAMGNQSFASGPNSTAFGNGAATGDNSFAVGKGVAIGAGSVAIGTGSRANGQASLAIGEANVTNGSYSSSLGFGNNVYGAGSFAIGQYNFIYRDSGFVFGEINTLNGNSYGGVSIGAYNGSQGNTGEYSVTLGADSTAIGNYSTAIGMGAVSYSYMNTALGSGNIGDGSATAWIETDPLLELGNKEWGGWESKENRSNAITTLKNGQTTLTNKAWKANPAVAPTTSNSNGNALVVDGHTVLNGKVIISVPQGDISMGIYQ